MYNIIIKAIGFVFIVFLGWFSVQMKLLTRADGKILSKIMLHITLPCALVSSFNGINFNGGMMLAVVLGVVIDLLAMGTGWLISDKKDSRTKTANNMLCCTSYNVGSFALPFAQSFFPGAGVGYLAMFDVGNCIICLGGSFMIVKNYIAGDRSFNPIKLIKQLSQSFCLMVYLALMTLSILHFRFPAPVLTITDMVGAAHVFVSMYMIGTQLSLNVNHEIVGNVAKIMGTRFITAVIFAVLFHLSPLDPTMSAVLTLAVFAPLSSPTVVYSQDAGCDNRVPAMVNSFTMPISILLYVVLLIILT